jgi:hypothetical protein
VRPSGGREVCFVCRLLRLGVKRQRAILWTKKKHTKGLVFDGVTAESQTMGPLRDEISKVYPVEFEPYGSSSCPLDCKEMSCM